MKEKREELKRLFNDLTFDEKIELMSEIYWNFHDCEKDEFLREIECN